MNLRSDRPGPSEGAAMSVKTDKMKAVFLAALDKTTAAERTAFLDEACADEAALRHSVEALLRAHDQADPLLDRPAAGTTSCSYRSGNLITAATGLAPHFESLSAAFGVK